MRVYENIKTTIGGYIFILTLFIISGGIAHTFVFYSNIVLDGYTSFPASIALLVFVPYAFCSVACLAVGLLIADSDKR